MFLGVAQDIGMALADLQSNYLQTKWMSKQTIKMHMYTKCVKCNELKMRLHWWVYMPKGHLNPCDSVSTSAFYIVKYRPGEMIAW